MVHDEFGVGWLSSKSLGLSMYVNVCVESIALQALIRKRPANPSGMMRVE